VKSRKYLSKTGNAHKIRFFDKKQVDESNGFMVLSASMV
jgi:hypothetical protein